MRRGRKRLVRDCRDCVRKLIRSLSPFQRDLQQLTDTSGASGHQKLRVCDVCGAYLSVLDSDRRLADHFGGKVIIPDIRFVTLVYSFASTDAPGVS